MLKSWSNRQASVALSSAEAELCAASRAGAEGLGLQSMMTELGWNLALEIRTDADAAKAILSRQGLGRTRHIAIRHLWMQGAVANKLLQVRRVKGTENPADPLTKLMGKEHIFELLDLVNVKA